MPTLKKDDVKQLSEPIVIEAGIIGDKEYRVERVTIDTIAQIKKEADSKDDTAPIKQLSILTGAPIEEFKGIDIRILGEVLNFIMSSISEGAKAKNPLKAEAKS